MESIYFYCAAIGGGVLILQTLLLIFVGGDMDGDMDADFGDASDALDGAGESSGGLAADAADAADLADSSDSILKVLSLKTVVAFLTFFGLTGLACIEAEMDNNWTIVISFAAGSVAVFIVAYLMRGLSELHSSGNMNLKNAVNCRGQVYLRIPGKFAGEGKVTLTVQGRKITRKAVTSGPEIPTGAAIRVTGLSGTEILEVTSLVEQ